MTLPSSGTLEFYLATEEPCSGVFPLILDVDPKPTGDLNLYVQTCDKANSWLGLDSLDWVEEDYQTWSEWGCGVAEGITTSGITLYANGATSIQWSGTFPLYMQNSGETGVQTGSMDLFGSAPVLSSGDIPLTLRVGDIPTGTVDMTIHGMSVASQSGIFADLNLYVRGRGFSGIIAEPTELTPDVSGNIPLMVQVSATGIIGSWATLYTCGSTLTAGNINLTLFNTATRNALYLYQCGYWTIGVTRSNSKSGGDDQSSSLTSVFGQHYTDLNDWGRNATSYLDDYRSRTGVDAPDSTFHSDNASIFGGDTQPDYTPDTGWIPLYLYDQGATGVMTLYATGEAVTTSTGCLDLIIPVVNNESGAKTLFIDAASGVSTGSMILCGRGYIDGI